ncbi:MAG: hypothetical protein DUD31_10880 [Coriobacteriaceae bacterium]|nr:MAG: hypothetical protein DUD31_10880 [Coriobacteriaceae bacterium]
MGNTLTQQQATKAHKQAYDTWPHGDVADVWTDDGGTLCVRYADGQWYHYAVEDNTIVWW